MDNFFRNNRLKLCEFPIYDKSLMQVLKRGFAYACIDNLKYWPFPIEQPWDGEIIKHLPE